MCHWGRDDAESHGPGRRMVIKQDISISVLVIAAARCSCDSIFNTEPTVFLSGKVLFFFPFFPWRCRTENLVYSKLSVSGSNWRWKCTKITYLFFQNINVTCKQMCNLPVLSNVLEKKTLFFVVHTVKQINCCRFSISVNGSVKCFLDLSGVFFHLWSATSGIFKSDG